MQFHVFIVYFVVLPCFVMSQYDSPIVSNKNPSSSIENQFQQTSNENYFVGNLSEPFSFQVAPSSIKVTYLGLNGLSLYIMSVGFSNKSKFNYDEKTNRLTILSLDLTTVGYYTAVDSNWKTFTNILSAINVSSLEIHNSHVSEDNNGSSLVSCSVSIIRSTFKLTESKSVGTEYLPRLNLFLSTRPTSSSIFSDKKIYNDTLNGQNFTRTITLQRPLTRGDHNGTIECQIESNNNIDIYLTKIVPIDIEYGPNLETGALEKINLESEVLKMIAMECQIEANPNPSYVWYEMMNNITNVQSVFGTTRQIQRIYQYSGQYAMECQAQSRGKTVKQLFFINVLPQSNAMKMKSDTDDNHAKSNKIPIIIGICIGSILLLLALAIIIATIIYLKRQKMSPDKKHSISDEKLSNDKQGKTRWGNLPIDHSKYKTESSSSTSHLVESAETNSIQAAPPPVPARPSPMTSTHSSYRQAPSTSVSLSYRQASALPGFRLPPLTRPYSPDQDDDGSTSMNVIPLTINRSKTNTPLGSHKSLSESIQSLRSNQQPSISLPVKKRLNDLPIKPPEIKKDYQHHHYHNPAELQTKTDNTSSEEEEEFEQQQQQQQQMNQISETKPITNSLGYNQVNFPSEQRRRNVLPSSPAQKMLIHHDEIPPSYQQISTTSSPSHAYVYQEPTEV